MTESETKTNWVLIATALIGVLSAISVALIGYYQYKSGVEANREKTSLEFISKREEKALELVPLILSKDPRKSQEGLLKLSILYKSEPDEEKIILDKIYALRVDLRKESKKAEKSTTSSDPLLFDGEEKRYVDESGVYIRLTDFLKNKRFKEADDETKRVIYWFIDGDYTKIKDLPCSELRKIDRLWVKYSDGRFGFSVQNKILDKLRSTKSEEKFPVELGWKNNDGWLWADSLTYDLSAPVGHLPCLNSGFCARFGWVGFNEIFEKCYL